MAPDLHFWHKSYVHERYVLELKIWIIQKTKDYPEGYKYRLICIDQKTGKRILFDNHSPKGHHFHIDDEQFSYAFSTEQNLMNDFKKHILEHMGVKL